MMKSIINVALLLLFALKINGQLENSPVCALDIGICEDGQEVIRVPPFCDFEPCPDSSCTLDVGTCPDGSTVGRVPPECNFEPCPGGDICTTDVLTCSDGTVYSRVPPECTFPECAPVTAPPTAAPTASPTSSPTDRETEEPTPSPTTEAPTLSPTAMPTWSPTESLPSPSATPSASPSSTPSVSPSTTPSASPSMAPSIPPSVSAMPTDVDESPAPSMAPTEVPSAAPTYINCSEYQHILEVPGLEGVTLEYVVNINYTAMYMMEAAMLYNETMLNETMNYGTISVRVTAEGQGWLGFGISPTGGMVGSDAVIGIPPNVPMLFDDAEQGEMLPVEGNVSKYFLTFENASGYLMLPEEQQTLMDYRVIQDEESTVLEFTRYLVEEDEMPINGTGFNYFLVARGMSNVLEYHGPNGRSSFNLTLEPCIDSETDGIPELFGDEDLVGDELPAVQQTDPVEESEDEAGEETARETPPTLQGTSGATAIYGFGIASLSVIAGFLFS